jgi:hypothetical protein
VTALVDPVVPTKDLISLREIARCFHGGMLTEGEAATAISRLSPEFVGAFTDTATAAAVVDMMTLFCRHAHRQPQGFRARNSIG